MHGTRHHPPNPSRPERLLARLVWRYHGVVPRSYTTRRTVGIRIYVDQVTHRAVASFEPVASADRSWGMQWRRLGTLGAFGIHGENSVHWELPTVASRRFVAGLYRRQSFRDVAAELIFDNEVPL